LKRIEKVLIQDRGAKIYEDGTRLDGLSHVAAGANEDDD
jgi:hypothetical protein